MTELRATHSHTKELGWCNAGVRRWFASRSVSFDQFRREGVSLAWLREQRDAMADRLIAHVEGRGNGIG